MEKIDLETGYLTVEQLQALFRTIPHEFDFIDQDDIVRWYSNNRSLFMREDKQLNQHVLEVHPAKSADRIEALLSQMKSGTKDKVSMVIPAKGTRILIQFFALRNSAGDYLGCVEVSEDVGQLIGEESKLKTLWRNFWQRR